MTKYILKTKTTGEPILMKDGRPFEYSSRDLATLGKRALEGERNKALVIVENK